jgi:hypothetical protein
MGQMLRGEGRQEDDGRDAKQPMQIRGGSDVVLCDSKEGKPCF